MHDLAGDKFQVLFDVGDVAGTGKAYLDSKGRVIFLIKKAVHIYDLEVGKAAVYYDQADCEYCK